MSFRLFVYWCALCGGWAAFAGWALGRVLAGEDPLGSAGIKGMCLGMLIALGLGVVDAVWVYSMHQVGRVVPRVGACVAVGAFGGLLGGFVGQLLYEQKNQAGFLIGGWGLTGLLVGISLGTYDFVRIWLRQENLRDVRSKFIRLILGGGGGGLLGGFLYLKLRDAWDGIFPDKASLWSPSATGFVALGLCIGLWIAIAQVALPEAWLRVEAGFRKGREMLLNKDVFSLGRAEDCDVGLFGDASIERLHARILRQGNQYLIEDAGSAGGTYVNDVRAAQPTPLKPGDRIRVGNAVLLFGARKKR